VFALPVVSRSKYFSSEASRQAKWAQDVRGSLGMVRPTKDFLTSIFQVGRVSRMNEQSSEVRMAINLQNLTLRLIESALSQKVEAKPAGNCRERSQGGPVMTRPDVAGLPSGTGLPLGRDRGRASALLAKSVFSASVVRSRRATQAVTGIRTLPVRPAIMSRTRKVHLTDEVLRRPASPRRVTAGYKPDAKGQPHASVRGTVSSRPPLQGWQQRRSRSGSVRFDGPTRSERQNLRVLPGSPGHMGPVSPTSPATQWPEGTSFPQRVGRLRNIPQQPGAAPAAVHPR